MAGMAQAKRTSDRLLEGEAEAASWSPPTIVALFASVAFELDRPQSLGANQL